MAHYEYNPKGVCSKLIEFDVEEGKIRNVKFTGGCNGNLKAIGRLVEGKEVKEIHDILKGNICGMRNTSCADQFALALEECM